VSFRIQSTQQSRPPRGGPPPPRGGGAAAPPPRPVPGRDKVLRILQGPGARGERLSVRGMRLAEINGQPGAMFLDPDGVPVVAVSLDIADGLIQTLHAVSNPEKLAHLRQAALDPG
jgi:RNA polymerase sigma-70 factor, ECF subfamily